MNHHPRRWPAEWEPQGGVQLTWADLETYWPGRADAMAATLAQAAALISHYEPVLIAAAASPQHVYAALERFGANQARIHLVPADADDIWARDHGPISVEEGGAHRLLDFQFNGWGGKFPAERDNLLTRSLFSVGAYGRPVRTPVDYYLEGGAIESDGLGTVLTTTQCLLNPTRNGATTREEVEAVLREHLGTKRVLWLEHGAIPGDDTDGHVDMLARFVSADTIAYVRDGGREDLARMEEELRAFRTPAGEPYRLVPLPNAAGLEEDGAPLPATYANFLVINDAVLVPVYGLDTDDAACAAVAGCFPDRIVHALDCRTSIAQGGAVHCFTMQFPEGIRLERHH